MVGLPYEQRKRRGEERSRKLESNKESNAKASHFRINMVKKGILRGNVRTCEIDFNNLVGLRNYNKEHVPAAFGANTNHSKDWGSGANEFTITHTNTLTSQKMHLKHTAKRLSSVCCRNDKEEANCMQDWTRFKWNYELRTKFVLLYLYVFTSISHSEPWHRCASIHKYQF